MINLDRIEKALKEVDEKGYTFVAEESSLTNEQVKILNSLSKEIRELIKIHGDDCFKNGYNTATYHIRCSTEGGNL